MRLPLKEDAAGSLSRPRIVQCAEEKHGPARQDAFFPSPSPSNKPGRGLPLLPSIDGESLNHAQSLLLLPDLDGESLGLTQTPLLLPTLDRAHLTLHTHIEGASSDRL